MCKMFQKYLLLILCALNIQNKERCTLNSRIHFGEPLPIIIRDNRILEPTDASGNIVLENGDTLTLSCEGIGTIHHPNKFTEKITATISCAGGTSFKNEEWLNAPADFSSFRCYEAPEHSSSRTNRSCFNGNPVYEVGYHVNDQFYALYESCFNELTLNAVYTKYTQRPYNALFQTKVSRPFFVANDVYGFVPVNNLFSPRGQKAAVNELVGAVVDKYVNEKEFLSRGHLAAKTDFVFAFGERASFHYVNCAPQWYGFNSGNWNTLEVDLRNHIHAAGLNTVIYTGTYGVTTLINEQGREVEIYLTRDLNNNPVVPVPLYFYKVVYESNTKRGVVFIGINGPYYNANKSKELFFCQDLRENLTLNWLTWHPHNPSEGYTFCCSVPDFRNTVHHLPDFEVTGLLFQ